MSDLVRTLMWENEDLLCEYEDDKGSFKSDLVVRFVMSFPVNGDIKILPPSSQTPSWPRTKCWTEAINFLSKSNCSKLIHWSRSPFCQSWTWTRCVFQIQMHRVCAWRNCFCSLKIRSKSRRNYTDKNSGKRIRIFVRCDFTEKFETFFAAYEF